MPARKESAARRKLREKLTLKPEKKKKPPKDNHVPTCATCPYLSARRTWKKYKRRVKRDPWWQWYCTHRDANNHKGITVSTAIGEPQLVKSADQMEVVHVRRPRWCPLMKDEKVKYFYEDLSK